MGIMNQIKDTWKENQRIAKEQMELKKQAQEEQANLVKIFRATKKYDKLQIDFANRLWRYGLLGNIKSFDDIVSIDIYENGSSIQSTMTGSMVGRAAVGSLINPAGAIIGGITAKKRALKLLIHYKYRSKLQILITPLYVSILLINRLKRILKIIAKHLLKRRICRHHYKLLYNNSNTPGTICSRGILC